MKLTLLTALLTLTITPLSVLAHPSPHPPTVLRKCMPLLGDLGEDEAYARTVDSMGVGVIGLPSKFTLPLKQRWFC
ncbi:hypothetical protein IFM46972_03395 [Aspergillus udagawae]|uniref:Uncharacterized protein n=1 Tax=Aspergillus udagawae TaxID=91492 RepID=A0A8H3NFB4_9EURO|nr:hypothetical protein IFM46972_03395 [Aspergillus udagawae]